VTIPSPYNSVVTFVRRIHDNLMIFRVRPDDGVFSFEPGQYATLGLERGEQRSDGIPVTAGHSPHMLIRRAFSFSCPVLDDRGNLVTCSETDDFEFYVTRVQKPTDDPPSLSPRLFALTPRRRIHVAPKPHGNYTLRPVRPGDDVLFLSTGTGEAPHNAMLAELLRRGHAGRLVSFVSVRRRADLGYLETHRELERRFDNYRYVPITTREPENVDPTHPQFVGKRHLQDLFTKERLAETLCWLPDPERTHFYLCGHPRMVGFPRYDPDGHAIYPEPPGMIERLESLGFPHDLPHKPGCVHFECY
jgi:ferredoxin/flavodoxin---NADP+ reductase